MPDTSDPLVIYTLAIGGTYNLLEAPQSDGVACICFTDQTDIDPNGWSIRPASLLLPGDAFRSSRDYKIRPHRFLPDYTRSIYIDSTVQLHCDAETLWRHLAPARSTIFGAMHHSFRNSVSDEFDCVEKARLDLPEILDEQRWTYQQTSPGLLQQRPIWGGMLARRHADALCIEAMEIWFANILRYSRRDQLSLPLALAVLPDEVAHILPKDIRKTEFHTWPVKKLPKPPGYKMRQGESWAVRSLRHVLRRMDNRARAR